MNSSHTPPTTTPAKTARFIHPRALVIGILLSLFVCTPILADDTEIFFSSDPDSTVRPNVLFVIDTSGSMNWTDGQPKTRLQRMKDALTTILQKATNINVGLMRFNGSNGGGPILFPMSYVDQDVCEIESCASSTTHSIAVNVAADSDDAEESNDTGAVTLDNSELHLTDNEALSGAATTTLEIDTVDDIEERYNNSLHFGSPDLDLFYSNGGNHLGVGLKFSGLTIPHGATILSAELEFTVYDKGKNNLDVDIYGDASDNAQDWLEVAGHRITDRTKTSAKVNWNNVENRNDNHTVTTPDMKTIVQEIVDRAGWASGNAMAFLLFVDGTSNNHNYRIFYSNETGGSTQGPKLRVTYQTAVGSADVTQTVGLRFDTVDIPQGATITNAYLEFEASKVASDPAALKVFGELASNPPTFANTSNAISGRLTGAPTAATSAWNVEAWDTIGTKYQSPDISSIVQEIVNQTDFCGGNAMSFFLTGAGARLAMAHEGSGAPPALKVTYTTDSIAAGHGCMKKTITKTIARNSDDAEEDSTDGSVSTGSSDLELITDNHDQYVGLRFQDLDIAQGATITEASLEFEIDEAGTGSINLKISGQNVDDASTFTGTTHDVSGRAKTSAYVTWNITDNPAVNAKLDSPDIKTVVQEIVNRAGWAPGNDMAFILEKSSGTGKRIVESRDGEADAAARLTVKVQWNEGDVTSTVQTVRTRLIDELGGMEAAGGTPIVDALYEGALYYRGENADYGKRRGTSTTSSDAKVHRVSHPASYTDGTVYRATGCTDDNLSATECKTERIDDTPKYISPITDSCQTSHIVMLSDGEPTSNSSASKVRSMVGISSCTASGDQACGTELTNFLANVDQSSAKTGVQTVKTYTIGFALDSGSDASAINFLQSLASDGASGFYTASSSADLVNAFDSIISNIVTTTSTFVAPGAAVNQFNRLIHDDQIYFSLFKPDNRPYWNGNLKKYKVTTGGLLDQNNALAVDNTTGMFKDTAQSFWSSAADGNEVNKGGAAAERSSSASRKVYTYISGSSSTTLSDSDNALTKDNTLVTTTALGMSASDTTLRDNVLDWADGVDLKDYDEDNNTTEARLQYGDPLHSKPVIVTYGGTADAPDNTIFFGTNEGYIHAVDADDGSEVFSFIPEELLPNLADLYNNSSATAHPYGMDGTVVVWAYDDNNNNVLTETTGGVNDHVYLYAGMRRGGRSYYALNVTDRSHPQYMWKVSGGSGTFAELAQTWSIPVKSKINLNGTVKDVIIVGGGYDDDQDNKISHATRQVDTEGRAIFMIDATTGALVWEGAYTGVTGANESFTDMKYSIPGEVRVIDINLDGYADMMFAADMGGQVWRFDIANGAASANDLVSGGVIADFGADSDTANNRRFYNTPDIALVKQGASKFLTIALGSGWRAHPLDKAVTDRFYVFRDSHWGSAPASYTKLTESDLVDVTTNIDAAAIASSISGGKYGWYITMGHSGEKILSTSVTVNNQVIFSTYTPEASSSTCSASQGTGRTYVVSVFDGTPTINFDLTVSSDPNALTVEDRSVTLQRSGIPPEATVLFAPDPVVLVGPEMPLSDLPFGDISQRTYWYQEEQ